MRARVTVRMRVWGLPFMRLLSLESMQSGLCQSCAMGDPGIVVQSVGEGNFEASIQFLTGWVSDGAAEAGASGTAAFRWSTSSPWPGRSGGKAWPHS